MLKIRESITCRRLWCATFRVGAPYFRVVSSPLPGSAWVEVESSTVEIDCGREVLRIAEAARLPFDAHDLAVQSLGHAVRDGMLHEAEHAIEMSLEHARDLLHGIETRPDGPAVPL